MTFRQDDPQDIERIVRSIVRAELVSITNLFASETARTFTEQCKRHLDAGEVAPGYAQALAHMTGVFEAVLKRLEMRRVAVTQEQESSGG